VLHLHLGDDALLVGVGEPLGGLALDLEDLVEGLRQQRRHFVPTLFVDDHRGATQVAVLFFVHRAAFHGLLDVVEHRFEHRAGEAGAEALRHPRPFAVTEELPARGAVEMLGGTAALLGVDELDAVVFLEHADVVGDEVQTLVELLGEQVWTGDALVQNDQDLYPEWVCEGFGDDLFDAVLLLRFRHGGLLSVVGKGHSGGKTPMQKTLTILNQEVQKRS
jgi:hypothetical protein